MTDFWEEVVSDYMDINFSTTEQSIWLCMSGKLGKMGERYAESFLGKTGNLPCEKHLICPPKKQDIVTSVHMVFNSSSAWSKKSKLMPKNLATSSSCC